MAPPDTKRDDIISFFFSGFPSIGLERRTGDMVLRPSSSPVTMKPDAVLRLVPDRVLRALVSSEPGQSDCLCLILCLSVPAQVEVS
jgi:hypothetical protein